MIRHLDERPLELRDIRRVIAWWTKDREGRTWNVVALPWDRDEELHIRVPHVVFQGVSTELAATGDGPGPSGGGVLRTVYHDYFVLHVTPDLALVTK